MNLFDDVQLQRAVDSISSYLMDCYCDQYHAIDVDRFNQLSDAYREAYLVNHTHEQLIEDIFDQWTIMAALRLHDADLVNGEAIEDFLPAVEL